MTSRCYPRLIGGPKDGEQVAHHLFDRPYIKVAVLEPINWRDEQMSTTTDFHTEGYYRVTFASKDSPTRLLYFAHESLTGNDSGRLLWDSMLDALGTFPLVKT